MTKPDRASREPPRPELAGNAAEFVAALRALRIWSGLTYRQLESKATALPDSLPASTMATTLGRTTLPRDRFVDTFTRACGLGEEETNRWLQAHARIAAGEPAPDGDDDEAPVSDEPTPARAPRWWHRAVALLGAAGIGAVGALWVGELTRDTSTSPGLPAAPMTELRMPAVGSWARIHPARAPQLCMTEGRDRTGRYEPAVAAQIPCTNEHLPQVFLEPVAEDTVQIQWHHPKYGIGCLTVMQSGPGRNLLEPRDDCADLNRAQRFRIERFGPSTADHFRIHPSITDWCLSLRDHDTESGTEIIQSHCSGATDQDFRIELTQPPETVVRPRT